MSAGINLHGVLIGVYMVSAIVMAGDQNPDEYGAFKRALIAYREGRPLRGKAVRRLRGRVGDRRVSRPAASWILSKLCRFGTLRTAGLDVKIDDIAIVGNKGELEKHLRDDISKSPIPITVVDQSEQIPREMLEEFRVTSSDFRHDSIAGNGLKAYTHTLAYQKKLDVLRRYALFVAADSPLTSEKSLRDVVKMSHENGYVPDSSIVFPIAAMPDLPWWRHCFHRKYGFAYNNTMHQFEDKHVFKSWLFGNTGFRLSSMMYADPFRFKIEYANTFYAMRKAVYTAFFMQLIPFRKTVISKYFGRPDLAKSVREVLRGHQLEDLWEGYFYGGFWSQWKKFLGVQKIGIREAETRINQTLASEGDAKITLMPIYDPGSTRDIDTTDDLHDVEAGLLRTA